LLGQLDSHSFCSVPGKETNNCITTTQVLILCEFMCYFFNPHITMK
jgi:hypothetical protein